MLFWVLIRTALRSLTANKLRSFLAMLGIIIGVGAVVSMLALGSGAERQVLAQINAMGTNLLVVRSGQRRRHGVSVGPRQNLTLEDARAILAEVPGIYQIAPVVSSNAQLKYYNRNTRANVVGTAITYFPVRNFEVERGRPFTESETGQMARVAVLGPVTVENLFGFGEPLGEVFKLNGVNFRVVGVLKARGDQGWFNPDNQVIVPYTTAMEMLFGLDHLREIDIRAEDGADLAKVEEAAAKVLRRRHRIRPEADDDFSIRNQAEMIEAAENMIRIFTILLGSIAGISLLVGGIGIMNIMLVSVTERTREIGIRKAIGAKDRDILRQFLIEAVLLSGLGGSLGLALGFGVAEIISRTTMLLAVVEAPSAILAISFSAAVGIFFGYYPARRAAMLDPIESLRYE